MSIYVKPGVFVRIEQLEGENAPRPLPLPNGFSNSKIYEVLGMHAPSESSEAFLILRNDRDEIWFISNRHVRIVDSPLSESRRRTVVQLNGHSQTSPR